MKTSSNIEIHNFGCSVFRDKKEFAWYIRAPLAPSPGDSRSPSPVGTVPSMQGKQNNTQGSSVQDKSPNQSQSTMLGEQNKPPGRPPNDATGSPPGYDFPNLLMTNSFSAVPG